MKYKKLLFLVFILSFTAASYADIIPKDLLNRKFEPIVVKANSMQALWGLSISQLFLYAYDADLAAWRIVPFQIDERNNTTGSYHEVDDGILDSNEEIVFMLKSLGDKVPVDLWRQDTDLTRICIEVVDTLRNQKGWVYLYHSASIDDFLFEDYMAYDAENDKVLSKYYEVGFDPGFGLPTNYTITEMGGGTNVDILDRFKVRILVDSDIGKIPINEDNIKMQEILPFFNSKVRFRRNMVVKIELKVTFGFITIPIELGPYEFPIDFYPYCMRGVFEIPLKFDDAPIDVNPKIKSMRTSNDYGINSIGMYFYNFFNSSQQTANLIDGIGTNTGIDRTLVVPGYNWMMVTGAPGTVLNINFVSDIGDSQELYFWDSFTGGSMVGVVGIGDTRTQGDSGILISGNNITGSFILGLTTYFLPPIENIVLSKSSGSFLATPMELGETLQANVASPPVVNSITEQIPLAVELADFYAIASKRDIQLHWRTVSETNNIGFELQRKSESVSYIDIAFIPGQGTITQPHDYSFTDFEVSGGKYFYRLKQIDNNGSFMYSDEIEVILAIPTDFALLQNYPNPFNPTTTLEFELATDGLVKLNIYNLAGQFMTTAFNQQKPAGRYRVQINAENWPSGIYFARLRAGGKVLTRKMLLLE